MFNTNMNMDASSIHCLGINVDDIKVTHNRVDNTLFECGLSIDGLYIQYKLD